jgi:hypothetical protein
MVFKDLAWRNCRNPRKTSTGNLAVVTIPTKLTLKSMVLIKTLTVAQLVKKFLSFHTAKGSVTCLLANHVLSHMNSVHFIISYCLKIHFPPMPMSPKWSLSFRFSDQTSCAFLIHPLHTTCLPIPHYPKQPSCCLVIHISMIWVQFLW